MATRKKELKPTHRAHLADGTTVDYRGAHPTAWSFGGVDGDGKPDGSRVRVVPVVSHHPLHVYDDAPKDAETRDDAETPEDDEDEDDEDGE